MEAVKQEVNETVEHAEELAEMASQNLHRVLMDHFNYDDSDARYFLDQVIEVIESDQADAFLDAIDRHLQLREGVQRRRDEGARLDARWRAFEITYEDIDSDEWQIL